MGLGEPGRRRGLPTRPQLLGGAVCPQGSRPRFLVSPACAGDAVIVTCKPGELWGGRPLGESRERGSGRGSVEVGGSERMRSDPNLRRVGRLAGPCWPKFIPWAGSHPIPSQLKAYGDGIPLGCQDSNHRSSPAAHEEPGTSARDILRTARAGQTPEPSL